MDFQTLIKKPSAFLPIVMSVVVLAVTLSYLVRFGVVHAADEGTPAHIFQILMAAQLPIILFFAIRWLPQHPRQAIAVLAVQGAAALAAMAPVFYFRL